MSLLSPATLWRAVSIGIDALRSHPLRTSISTLGVAAGVAVLVVVLALGEGMERAARSEIERTTDFQTIAVSSVTSRVEDGMPTPVRGFPVLSAEDVNESVSIPGSVAATLTVSGAAMIELPDRGGRLYALISGTTASADQFMRLEIESGRFFSAPEVRAERAVIVLSQLAARMLAPDEDPERLLGRGVRIRGRSFEVVGILQGFRGEREVRAFLPISKAQALLGAATATPTLLIRSVSLDSVEAVRAATRNWLAERYGRRAELLSVRSATDRLTQVQRGVRLFKYFVGAIAALSVLVGGIGIMNVLLASVTERTREIGMRKASGARRLDIGLQFIAESVAITGLGSGAGVVAGAVMAIAVGAVLQSAASGLFLDVDLRWSTLLLPAVVPILIGLVFGIYPALRAGRLSPIDAMRHE